MQPGMLIFWIGCSAVCFSEARRFRDRYGKSPFGWSPGMWAVVGLLLSVIALVMIGIAEQIGRKAAAQQPVGYGAQNYGPPAGFGYPPAYGQPAAFTPPPPLGAPTNPWAVPPAPSAAPLLPPPPPSGNILPG